MDYKYISLNVTNGVATLLLNRPECLNALHFQTLEELLNALGRVAEDKAARVLVVSGAGRAFCSGADLDTSSWEGATVGGADAGTVLETHLNPLVQAMSALPIPVVAAVNGPAAGAGVSLALAADIVIASYEAYFMLAFVNIGLVPDAGVTWMLPRFVGSARAKALMMLGERLTARQAVDWGLIYEAVEPDVLQKRTQEIAEKLSSGPTVAIRLIKQGFSHAQDTGFVASLEVERHNQKIAGETRDFAEGIAAFAEKRRPRFMGC